jgi:hypothetical protein
VGRALLERYGLRFPAEGPAASVEDALSVAARIGYPVVLKTGRPDVLHKTDAGGVIVGIRGADDLRDAAARLGTRFGPALLVQRQVEEGLELLVGGRRDPVFGPTVAFGLGGIFAEALGEVRLALAPLTPAAAAALAREGRAGSLLGGIRGRPPVDADALGAVLAGVGDLLADHPRVVELDVNPLIARGAEILAVDALVIMDQGGTPDA